MSSGQFDNGNYMLTEESLESVTLRSPKRRQKQVLLKPALPI